MNKPRKDIKSMNVFANGSMMKQGSMSRLIPNGNSMINTDQPKSNTKYTLNNYNGHQNKHSSVKYQHNGNNKKI